MRILLHASLEITQAVLLPEAQILHDLTAGPGKIFSKEVYQENAGVTQLATCMSGFFNPPWWKVKIIGHFSQDVLGAFFVCFSDALLFLLEGPGGSTSVGLQLVDALFHPTNKGFRADEYLSDGFRSGVDLSSLPDEVGVLFTAPVESRQNFPGDKKFRLIIFQVITQAGAPVGFGFGSSPGDAGSQVNMAGNVGEAFLIHHVTLEAAVKEMAAAAVTLVVVNRVCREQSPHELGESRPLAAFHQQEKMVLHQAPGMNTEPENKRKLLQQLKKVSPVRLIDKRKLPLIGSRDEVIKAIG